MIIFAVSWLALEDKIRPNKLACPGFTNLGMHKFDLGQQAVMESSTQLPSTSTSTAKKFEYEYEY